MRRWIWLLCLCVMSFCSASAQEAKPTAVPNAYPYPMTTPIPDEIKTYTVPTVIEDGQMIPETIQRMLDTGLSEWQMVHGHRIAEKNKYLYEVYGYDRRKPGWCSDFVLFCMLRAGVPLYAAEAVPPAEETAVGFFGERVRELRASYENAGRATLTPRTGYLVVYSDRNGNLSTHIGMLTEVTALENGLFELQTVEGNVKDTIKRYRYLYDPADPEDNMRRIPDKDDHEGNFQYKLHSSAWYIGTFLATW